MAKNKDVKIYDIAKHANVSASTVSRVLSGKTAVNESKRRAVMAAVSELDYQPNVFARSLASGQSMTIGVLTQNFGSPFYDSILTGILRGLENSSYTPLFVDGRWQPELEQEAVQTLLGRRVDGLIMVGGQTADETLHQIARQIPLIICARQIPGMENHCLYVDNFQGGYDATRYLLELGHRRIAHISGLASQQDSQQRVAGYQQALRDSGIDPNPALMVEGDFQPQLGVIATEILLARGRPFSAIFSSNDQMAFGSRLFLYKRGIRVPEDVSLIGFDDQFASAFTTPPLTTMRQPGVEMGQAGAEAILQLINGQTVELEPFKASLVIRESIAQYN